jgi:4-carboxymuconolactone decarboxylase
VSDIEDAAFVAGMKIRRMMFGSSGAEERLARATDFEPPFEEVVSRRSFGETWTRPGLDLDSTARLVA